MVVEEVGKPVHRRSEGTSLAKALSTVSHLPLAHNQEQAYFNLCWIIVSTIYERMLSLAAGRRNHNMDAMQMNRRLL
jgi:hypothetical protein